MTATLVCVPPSDVWTLWPAVEPLIDAAYAELDMLTPDVCGWLEAQKGLLWVVTDGVNVIAAATTSLEPRRGGLACRVVAAGGPGTGLDFWKIHIGAIERYAKAERCYKVEIDGRQGWARVLSGYAPKAVSLEKRL